MFTKLYSICICLVGFTAFCFADSTLAVPKQKLKNYAALSAETKILQFGPFLLQAEDLNVRIKRDDRKIIKLGYDAQILCGETRLSADRIEVTYKDQHDQSIILQGDVEIENEREQLRMFAREANLVRRGSVRYLILRSRNREHVRLIRTSDQKTTQIEGSMIQMTFQGLHTLLIQPIENVSIKERPARSTDLVKIETTAQSKFDFFDEIAITDIKLYSKDWSVQAKKPNLHN